MQKMTQHQQHSDALQGFRLNASIHSWIALFRVEDFINQSDNGPLLFSKRPQGDVTFEYGPQADRNIKNKKSTGFGIIGHGR